MGFGRGGGSFGGDAFARSPLQDVWGVQRLSAEVSAGLAAITSGSDLATIMGCSAPDALWKGDETGGSTTSDLVGSADLGDVGSPTRGTNSATFGVNGIELTSGSTDSLAAASSSVCDPTTGSFTIVYVADGVNGAVQSIFVAKQQMSPLRTYNLYMEALGYLKFYVQTSTSTKQVTISLDHIGGPVVLLVRVDNAQNVTGVYSGLGYSTTAKPGGSVANSGLYGIGDSTESAANAAGCTWCMAAYWEGTNAEGITGTHRQALADYLGVA